MFATAILWTALAFAEEPRPILLKDADGVVSLGKQLDILVDTTGELGIEDVMDPARAADFKPSDQDTPSFGFTKDAIWTRFTLAADKSAPAYYMVELEMTRLSHFDWYVVDEGKVVQRLACGSADVAPGTRRSSRFPMLTVAIRRDKQVTVYARAASETSVWLPLTASTPAANLEHDLRRDWIDSALVGCSFAMILISLSLGLIFRRRIYILAALMPPSFLLHQLTFGGHYLLLDIAWPTWVGRQCLLFAVLAFCWTLALFVREFFADRAPSATLRLGTRLAQALLVLAAASILILPYRAAAQVSQALFILSFLSTSWVIISETRRHASAEALILLFGGLTPLATTLLLLFQWTNLIPTHIEPAELLRSVLPATFVMFLLACARSQQTVQEVESKLEAARRAETEARLEALRHQLNPHFSYNALASIDALSREAPERIPELVSRLGAFLRHRMAPSGQPINELGNELEAARAYLEVERVRLEDRLKVAYEVDPAALRALVPEFCLQPLAENALKYGLAEAGSVSVRIAAQVLDGRLRLTVANTGRIRGEGAVRRGAGIGLGNLRRRLALHHGADARVELTETDGWVTATMDIPFRENPTQ